MMTMPQSNFEAPRSGEGPWTPRARALALVLLTLWALAAFAVGELRLLENRGGYPIPPVALGVVVPVAIFLALYAALPRFRAFVLAQDLVFLTQLHAWRVVGFGFLLLYAHGVLPGLFAWPAGLGDLAIGLAAPFVALAVSRRPAFAESAGFRNFHILGMLDFVAAVGSATLASGLYPAIHAGPVTATVMEVWPLSVFPTFGVPLFIMLHLTVFLKLAVQRRQAIDNRLKTA